ncbi:MAG: peroxiredoxin [Candidatus Kryptonium sp.]|nr:peroxiredoxin [Candidatus Kryptonium sp.]MCX7763244.1 peroxiredoxin [Candidatus Kryptonium sp.]MDW8108103.1 peroxiredoxin [Candidatus Kryptonium sp.]
MRSLVYTFAISIFILINAYSQSLKVGDKAPDFKLPYATKDTIVFSGISLSELIGKRNIVLAFYPADWSGGCTTEMCTFRDNFVELSKLDAEILGISGDYVFSHHEWAKHLNLQFKLLSDHKHEVARLYDSYDENSGYNKRTIFVIDKKGRIAYINWRYNVRDPKHFEELRKVLANLP